MTCRPNAFTGSKGGSEDDGGCACPLPASVKSMSWSWPGRRAFELDGCARTFGRLQPLPQCPGSGEIELQPLGDGDQQRLTPATGRGSELGFDRGQIGAAPAPG